MRFGFSKSIFLCMAIATTPLLAKTTLYMNNVEEPSSLHPAQGFNSNSWEPLNNIMEGLVRLDKDHKAAPAVAESYTISEDGLTYTFKLRPDLKWSNGDSLTAQDFVFAWTQMLDPKTASPAAFLASDIKGAQAFNEGKGGDLGIKAIDDRTFEVKLEKPNVAFLNIITNPSFFPINQKVASANPKWFTEAETFVGNGPFLLKQWKHSQGIVLEKNPQYWDKDAVKLDEVDMVMVNDENTSYQMYRSDELDMTPSPIPASMYDKLKDNKELQNLPTAGVYFFRFNVGMEPFNNKNIRKAFAMAINRDELVKYVVKQGRKTADGFVSPGFVGPNSKDFRDESGDLIRFDAAEAKKLLEAGMKEQNYSKLPEVTLSFVNNPSDKKIAETIQNMLKQNLGVDIKLQSMESKVFFSKQRASELQFSRSSFLNDYADPYNSLESFLTGSSMNRTKWSNENYDQLVKGARNEVDPNKRWNMLIEAEKILLEEAPIFPLYFYNQIFMQKPNVKGVLRHPVGWIDLKGATKD